MTTEAQEAANKRNGKMSNGPITDAGKAISSRNATKHGIFRTSSGIVEAGPFAEAPGFVAEMQATIERGLRPRDSLERLLARRIADLHLDLERANAYKNLSLAAPSKRRGGSEADDPTPADAEHVMERLDYAMRLTGKAFRQLQLAMAQYSALQERQLEVSYTGDIEIEVDVNEVVTARAQEALWRSRAEALESEEARAAEEAAFGIDRGRTEPADGGRRLGEERAAEAMSTVGTTVTATGSDDCGTQLTIGDAFVDAAP